MENHYSSLDTEQGRFIKPNGQYIVYLHEHKYYVHFTGLQGSLCLVRDK